MKRRVNRPGFLSVKDVIEKLTRDMGVEDKRQDFECLRDWAEVVGKRVADHSEPLYIRNKILFIRVNGASWAQEISFRKTPIVDMVNQRFGVPRIVDIRTRIETPQAKTTS